MPEADQTVFRVGDPVTNNIFPDDIARLIVNHGQADLVEIGLAQFDEGP